MKIEERKTLSLVASSTWERDSWVDLLTPYSWAEGEFGVLCTEAAFRKFCADSQNNPEIPTKLKEEAHRFGALALSGDYADVCLQNGIIGASARE